ncbi:MAG: DUF6694 family lipoprotein [Eudoraea sp.]|uniref:DUF6694 family lipoprotein n=1 Tax=Eudoraea sp. TaxID=1979955 RepID=UPI003264D8AE
MKYNYFYVLILLLLFISCAKKIDSTSDESYQTSIENLKKSLSDEEKIKFEESLQKIALENVESLADLSNAEKFIEDVRTKLDGMSYEDVIKEGERIQKIIDEKNREQAKLEIEELYEKMDSSTKDVLFEVRLFY